MKFKVKENAVEEAMRKIKEAEGNPLPTFEEMSDKDLITFLGIMLRLSERGEISGEKFDDVLDDVLNEIEKRAVQYGRQMMVDEGLASWEE